MLDTQFGEITPCLSILHCSLFLFHTFLGLSCHHEHVVSIHHILPGSWTAETLIAPFLASIHHLSLSENISVGIMMLDQWIYGYDMVFCFRKNPFQWIRRFCFSNHFFGSKKKTGPESLLRWCWKLPPLPGWFFTTYIMSYSTNHQEIIVTNSGYINIIEGSFVEKLRVKDVFSTSKKRSLCPVGMCLKRSWSHILTSPKIIVSSWHVP